MMSKTRKWVACLIAALLVFQAVPAMMEEDAYISNVTVGSLAGFRDTMEIISEGGAYMLTGDVMTLTTNEDYAPVWESSNADVVVIEEGNAASHAVTVRAVGFGTADIVAVDGNQTKVFAVTVIDPETVEGAEKSEGGEEGEDEELDETGKPIQKQKIVIVINGGTLSSPYTGEEQSFGEYTASSSYESFDPEKVKLNREIEVKGTECGYYQMNLTEQDFSYDDKTVKAVFVINDGYLKITPVLVTVTPNEVTKTAGEEDPALTATVTGLLNEEDTIEYTLSRDEGEYAGTYVIKAEGEEMQRNYRIQYMNGTFNILPQEGNPRRVTITSNLVAGEPVYAGTEITLTAHPEGFEGVNYTLQWQFSEDLQTWTDEPGATDMTFTYVLDEETAPFTWRVVAIEVAE